MEKEFDILSIFKTFKDHLIAIIAITLLCAILGFCFATFVMPERYEASYKLLIINTNDSTYFQQAIINANEALGMIYTQLSKSDDILSAIKDDLSDKYNEKVNESFIRGSISISADSVGFLTYTITTSNAELSEDIAKSASVIVPEVLERSGYGTKIEIINNPGRAVQRSSTALYTALGAAGGLFVTWLFFFIRLFFNTAIVSKSDIDAYFTAPVLGEIPSWDGE